MITSREHRVAIATEDGRRIADHFRAAPVFIWGDDMVDKVIAATEA